jgi:ubiquinone/menaquinone biosynthesis C-methylase UbiE
LERGCMPLVMDPAGNEIRALQKATQWKGKGVLEVGCGEGRLTLRIAALGPRRIEALDPDNTRVRLARKNQPAFYSRRIKYHVGHSERLRFHDDLFDIVIFSWVL